MSAWLLTAALLAITVGAAHSYLGERYILQRLFRRGNLPHLFGSEVFTKGTLRFAWHITTVAWLGMAGAFCALGTGSPRFAVQILSAAFFASALTAGVASRGRHLSWIVFLLIAITSWMGSQTIS